jgi:hypothetical protein
MRIRIRNHKRGYKLQEAGTPDEVAGIPDKYKNKKNSSNFKCKLYTWIRIQQLKLMRIHADPDPKSVA